jgi:hypothetical protein
MASSTSLTFFTVSNIEIERFNPFYSEEQLKNSAQQEWARHIRTMDETCQTSRHMARQFIAAENHPKASVEQKKIIELLKLSINDKTRGEDRSPYHSNLQLTRDIGICLNELDGFRLMSLACNLVPIYDQKDLSSAWNGIGEWKD